MLNDVKKYLAFLQFEKKLSQNTLESYWLDLKHYIEYLENEKNIKIFKDIKINTTREYINDISQYSYNINEELSTASLNRKISSLKGFHKYLFLNDLSMIDPTKIIKSVKPIKKLPTTLSVEDIDLLLSSDKLIISSIWNSGFTHP